MTTHPPNRHQEEISGAAHALQGSGRAGGRTPRASLAGVTLVALARVRRPVRTMLARAGVTEANGAEQLFPSVEVGMAAFQARSVPLARTGDDDAPG